MFPRKKYKRGAFGWSTSRLNFGLPSKWLNSDILLFTKWFHRFVKLLADDPVLLIDGQYSHNKHLDVVDTATEHSVSNVSLPPHSVHKMQPLDVCFMKPLKYTMYQKLKHG
jgi:hypothetical protein